MNRVGLFVFIVGSVGQSKLRLNISWMSCLKFLILFVAAARFDDAPSAALTWWWRYKVTNVAVAIVVLWYAVW